jgi:hypothetical protein
MSFADRLGIAGLFVAIVGIAAPYLWPDAKIIGWIALGLAGALVLAWPVLEIKRRMGEAKLSLLMSVGVGGVVGSIAAALIWYSASPKTEVAGESVKESAKSTDIAEQTLRVSQGAQVYTFEWESRNIGADRHPIFRARVANVGHTAAIIVDDWCKVTVDAKLPPEPVYEKHPVRIQLPPGAGIFMEVDGSTPPGILLTESHIRELEAGQKSMFVWGRITFTDVFGDVWELGYAVKFAPFKTDGRQIAWRDVSADAPNYVFLKKQPGEGAR